MSGFSCNPMLQNLALGLVEEERQQDLLLGALEGQPAEQETAAVEGGGAEAGEDDDGEQEGTGKVGAVLKLLKDSKPAEGKSGEGSGPQQQQAGQKKPKIQELS